MLASRTGGNESGNSCGGRACRDVMSVARMVGGTGDSGTRQWRRVWMSTMVLTTPSAKIGQGRLFGFFFGGVRSHYVD